MKRKYRYQDLAYIFKIQYRDGRCLNIAQPSGENNVEKRPSDHKIKMAHILIRWRREQEAQGIFVNVIQEVHHFHVSKEEYMAK